MSFATSNKFWDIDSKDAHIPDHLAQFHGDRLSRDIVLKLRKETAPNLGGEAQNFGTYIA